MKSIYKKTWIVVTALFLGVALAGCHASYSGSINSQSSTASTK